MIFDIVPSNTVRLVEGYMPMQMLLELTCFVAGFAGIELHDGAMGMPFPRFWQGIGFWAFILLYLKFRVYPPIPFSVRAMYGTVSLVAVFMWVSANEEDWKKFKQPIMNVLDAQTGVNKLLRYAYLVLLPILIGGFSYNAMSAEVRRADRVADGASGPAGQHQGAWQDLYIADVTESVSGKS